MTSTHSTPDLSILIADQVQTIRLTRTSKKNALTAQMSVKKSSSRSAACSSRGTA